MEYNSIFLCSLLFNVVPCLGREKLVVDGEKAQLTDFRHSAFLNVSCYLTEQDAWDQWSCGASIVNQRALLTAAHCIDIKCEKYEIDIRIGNRKAEKGKLYKHSHFKIHEKYNITTNANDIAIIITKENIVFGKKVARVALMKNPPEDFAYVAGWGTTILQFAAQPTDYLHYARQKIIDDKTCLKLLKKDKPKGTLCALPVQGYPANADSGSALVVKDYIQVGIVSYTLHGLYALNIYTKIDYFLPWIKKTIKKQYCIEVKL